MCSSAKASAILKYQGCADLALIPALSTAHLLVGAFIIFHVIIYIVTLKNTDKHQLHSSGSNIT